MIQQMVERDRPDGQPQAATACAVGRRHSSSGVGLTSRAAATQREQVTQEHAGGFERWRPRPQRTIAVRPKINTSDQIRSRWWRCATDTAVELAQGVGERHAVHQQNGKSRRWSACLHRSEVFSTTRDVPSQTARSGVGPVSRGGSWGMQALPGGQQPEPPAPIAGTHSTADGHCHKAKLSRWCRCLLALVGYFAIVVGLQRDFRQQVYVHQSWFGLGNMLLQLTCCRAVQLMARKKIYFVFVMHVAPLCACGRPVGRWR